MSANVLSSKSVRRIARELDLPIIHAWTNCHGQWINFTTADHAHASYDRRSGAVEWLQGEHWVSCARFFPDPVDWLEGEYPTWAQKVYR